MDQAFVHQVKQAVEDNIVEVYGLQVRAQLRVPGECMQCPKSRSRESTVERFVCLTSTTPERVGFELASEVQLFFFFFFICLHSSSHSVHLTIHR